MKKYDLFQKSPLQFEKSPLLRLPEVLALLKISQSCWYAGIRAGRYPKGIKIGARATAWRKEDIYEIMQSGVGARQ